MSTEDPTRMAMENDDIESFVKTNGNLVVRNRKPFIPEPRVNAIISEEDVLTFSEDIGRCYEEIVHWRRNIFEVPSGAIGRRFVKLLTSWLEHFNAATKFQPIAMKTFLILPALLLQKPSKQSKPAEHKRLLEERMDLFEEGEVMRVFKSARMIQWKLVTSKRKPVDETRKFSQLMFEGKVRQAMRMLTEEDKGVLKLDPETKHLLEKKHPPPAPVRADSLLHGPMEVPDPEFFSEITGHMVARAARMMQGAAGPTTTDAEFFKRILTNKTFKKERLELCQEIARFAKTYATTYIDPKLLDAFLNSRLIPLNKCPGVRPIGVGETFRRIVGKVIAWTLKEEIQVVAGPRQVCTGVKSGSEAAVHFIRQQFEAEEAEACILVDASNAFNAVNRQVMLHNIQVLCPEFGPVAVNMYRTSSRLFVDGSEMLSKEGFTQGDNLAMALFAIATLPILRNLDELKDVNQAWLADDATATGRLEGLRKWWDEIVAMGLRFGYYVNAAKSCLIVKDPNIVDWAEFIFRGSGISIRSSGQRHLGAPLGSTTFKEEYVENLVDEWLGILGKLVEYSRTQPHAAYSVFTKGVRHKLTYFMRTIPGIGQNLKSLDKCITEKLLPSFFGCQLTPLERRIMSLPPKFGGLGIPILEELAEEEYEMSLASTRKLVGSMYDGEETEGDTSLEELVKTREARYKESVEEICNMATPMLKRHLEQAREDGASSWLTALPLQKHDFVLNKAEFRDTLRLRYGMALPSLPEKCVCGEDATPEHLINCHKGGYVMHRHNKVCNILAGHISTVCKDVQREPRLLELEGERLEARTAARGDEARPDIKAGSFYRDGQVAFFDIQVVNPNSKSYLKKSVKSVLQQCERQKINKYNERILNVERGTFCPLIFSITGGCGPEAKIFLKLLSDKISKKKKERYNDVISFLRIKLSFTLLKLVLLCIRGSRATFIESGDVKIVEDFSYSVNEIF